MAQTHFPAHALFFSVANSGVWLLQSWIKGNFVFGLQNFKNFHLQESTKESLSKPKSIIFRNRLTQKYSNTNEILVASFLLRADDASQGNYSLKICHSSLF